MIRLFDVKLYYWNLEYRQGIFSSGTADKLFTPLKKLVLSLNNCLLILEASQKVYLGIKIGQVHLKMTNKYISEIFPVNKKKISLLDELI